MAEKTGATKLDLEERLPEFSTRILRAVESMPRSEAGRHVGGQLLRAGTSPYASHGEADQLIRIFRQSILTARKNRDSRPHK